MNGSKFIQHSINVIIFLLFLAGCTTSTAVPGNGWDSTDPKSGNAWENQALFDYDDRALPALGELLNP